MSTTQSGRLLLPQNYGVPTLHDIAIQSGRIVRFVGAARAHWTVLHHLIVCHQLAVCAAGDRLVALLHDADEVATSDIPTLWKVPEQRRSVDGLQSRVYETYMGDVPTPEQRMQNKFIDKLALTAEMVAIGPPNVLEHSGLTAYVATLPEGRLSHAVGVVNDVSRALPDERHTMRGTASTGVWWLLALLREAGVRNPFNEDLKPPTGIEVGGAA